MEPRKQFGVVSVFFGLMALAAAIAATEADRMRQPGVGYLLNCMDRWGLVRAPSPNQKLEWRRLGPFDLTDQLALKGLLVYSACFGISAMLIALWAEHQQEESPSLGLGFILGAVALHIHGFQYSMPALLIGGAILFVIRRRQRPNPSIERTSPGKPGLASHVKR